MFSKSVKHLAFLGAIAASESVVALDESRLWLPTNFEKYYLDLKASALAAESLDRCNEVLRGTIDLDQSRPGHPIFRILCRQATGRTYNEMVDGLTKKTLTTVIVTPPTPTPEELEQQRVNAEKYAEDQREQRLAQMYEQCEAEFQSKTALFQNLEVLSSHKSPIEQTEAFTRFTFDFNAKDSRGEVLRFVANCRYDGDQGPKVSFQARELTPEERAEQLQSMYDRCKALFDSKTELFEHLELLPSDKAPVANPDSATEFKFDFNARDVHGAHLHYQADCLYEGGFEPTLTIRPRKAE